MDRRNILQKVNAIFCEAFIDDSLRISEDTCAADIEEWDSLMQITLITAVESEFDVQFNLDDVLKMKNVGDMIDLIIKNKNDEK